MSDLDEAVLKLARLSSDHNPYQRVPLIRQILDSVRREGYEEGYRKAMQDRGTADLIADDDGRKDAATERARIAAHFDDMVVTREWRRRFEDRHAGLLSDGVTAHGLLSAVVAEIKALGALPERTETDA